MKYMIHIKFIFSVYIALFFCINLSAQPLMGDVFSAGGDQQSNGPTQISSNTMDFNLKGNTIILSGNVIVNNETTRLKADKITVILVNKKEKSTPEKTSTPDKKTQKEAKEIIAEGNVIIIKKPSPEQKGKAKEEKATAGKAEYNLKTDIIVLTKNPILYQGDSYVKGNRITLYRNTNRVKVEGNQSMGQQTSKLIFNPDKNGK